MRQIVLDTETTGLEPSDGHRIIEIGCVELINRKLTGQHYHVYINPERQVDEGAIAVHGITNEFLDDKPLFDQVAKPFMEFVKGAELIIHNADFDVGFINHELQLLSDDWQTLQHLCKITDSLKLARKKHPGQRNNLDALCKRYEIDNSSRELHGALLDAEILAEVYLAMTGGQAVIDFTAAMTLSRTKGREQSAGEVYSSNGRISNPLRADRPTLPVLEATAEELQAHQERMQHIFKASGQSSSDAF